MPKTFTFAKADWTLPEDFSVGEVSALTVLLKGCGKGDTLPEQQARKSVIHKGLQMAGYAGDFTAFEQLRGTNPIEMVKTVTIIGRAIGYYEDPEAVPQGEAQGEVQGEESP